MREWQSPSHVRWYCKYHRVFVPKYRRRALYGPLRRRIGPMVRELGFVAIFTQQVLRGQVSLPGWMIRQPVHRTVRP